MAQRFEGDDHGYKRWLFAHPAGFVLNAGGSSKLTLHAAGCSTLVEPGSGETATSVAKVCDASIGELERWAHANYDADPTECGVCTPYAHVSDRPGSEDRARSHPGEH